MTIPVTGATEHVGVIGDPVRHSLSPLLHNAGYAALGLDISYGAFPVKEGDARAALIAARTLGFLGLSVTTPHKDAIALAADQRTPRVELLGAANTVVFAAGISIAESTDGEGLLADLSRSCSFSPAAASCAVIGAGGAARAVVLALAEAGAAEVVVVNRTRSRAEAAALLGGSAGRVGASEDLAHADLVVNATSLGLSASGDPTGAELGAGLHAGQLVIDLVYNPAHTAFLEAAKAAGAETRNGLGMLVHQAARQFELFTNHAAPLEAMWAVVEDRPTS